ncbi:MAG TPA: sugar phosphate isomerase/epimerase [Gaiellaceae bacterium]
MRRSSAEDFRGTLGDVARLGFEAVELFDLHGHAAENVRGWLDELGLVVCSRHTRLEAIESDLDSLAAEAETLGVRRLVVAWIEPPATEADADAVHRRLASAAAAAGERGLELGFHNHDAEVRPLDGGRTFLDGLPPDVFTELDLGWIWWAGLDPLALLERFSGRSPLVHVKDFRNRDERSYCAVGDGAVGYEQVAPAAVKSGAEWLLIEFDEPDRSELEDAERSIAALRRMLAAA